MPFSDYFVFFVGKLSVTTFSNEIASAGCQLPALLWTSWCSIVKTAAAGKVFEAVTEELVENAHLSA